MATPKQIAANRANSGKSTGPRTPEGKANSRFNALKHGIFAVSQIMFDEKAEDLAELAAEYHEQYSPANPDERFLVDTLIHNEWRLRRMRRVEAELWDLATKFFLQENSGASHCSSGEAFDRGDSTFERLQRIVNSCQRIYHRTHKELQRVQAERVHRLSTSQPQQSTTTSANLASSRENPQTPAPAAPEIAPAPPVAQAAARSQSASCSVLPASSDRKGS